MDADSSSSPTRPVTSNAPPTSSPALQRGQSCNKHYSPAAAAYDPAFVEKFAEKCLAMAHTEQAKWWLDCYWDEGAKANADQIWDYTHTFMAMDKKLQSKGRQLDQFEAQQFFEKIGETLTGQELRAQIQIRKDDNSHNISLLEFLLYKYQVGCADKLVQTPDHVKAKMKETADKLESLREFLAKLREEKMNLEEAINEQTAAKKVLMEAKVEADGSLTQLQNEKSAHQNKLESLEGMISNEDASTVARNKARAEYAQLLAQDSLPIRKGEITMKAALRKVDTETKKVAAKSAATDANRVEVEKAEIDVQTKVSEAMAEIEKYGALKSDDSSPGMLWWMQREIKEAEKFLPDKLKSLSIS